MMTNQEINGTDEIDLVTPTPCGIWSHVLPLCGIQATLNPAWTSNHIHYKVWDEITYPFLNFNRCTVEV